jgi:hypothetical protein
MKFAYTADIHLSKYGQDTIEQTSSLPERLDKIQLNKLVVCQKDYTALKQF